MDLFDESCFLTDVRIANQVFSRHVKAFEEYVHRLRTLLCTRGDRQTDLWKTEIGAVLDGQPSAVLRRLVKTETLRATGAFFTGARLAEKALRPALESLTQNSVVVDPACGAGDLLLACSRRLSAKATLSETLEDWGSRLVGRDIFGEFVATAKIRLALQAIQKTGFPEEPFPPSDRLFPRITTGSGLADGALFASATHIVVNPPFGVVPVPEGCAWTSGTVNAAAVFLEDVLRRGPKGGQIVAILPDVLRSGTRYHVWRQLVDRLCEIESVEILGQFAPDVDVDVFAFVGRIRSPLSLAKATDWMGSISQTCPRLDDVFKISVGPVVPYRDPHEGPSVPIVYPKSLPTWDVVREVNDRRRFSGKTIESPFVVVRRTSRPGDPHRAVATIIATGCPVAVENHLLVLVPRDGTIRLCHQALRVLRRPETTAWLNRRIRCRHLTVAALRDLPLWDSAIQAACPVAEEK